MQQQESIYQNNDLITNAFEQFKCRLNSLNVECWWQYWPVLPRLLLSLISLDCIQNLHPG